MNRREEQRGFAITNNNPPPDSEVSCTASDKLWAATTAERGALEGGRKGSSAVKEGCTAGGTGSLAPDVQGTHTRCMAAVLSSCLTRVLLRGSWRARSPPGGFGCHPHPRRAVLGMAGHSGAAGGGLGSERCVPCAGGKMGEEAVLSTSECHQLAQSFVGTPADAPPVRFALADSMLVCEFTARNWQCAVELVGTFGDVMEEQGHHADVHLTEYRKVRLELTTHAVGGRLTRNDFVLAAKLAELDLPDALFSPKWLAGAREGTPATRDPPN